MGKLVLFINKFLSKFNIFRKRVDYIGGNDALPPPLKKDEEEELVDKLSTGGEGVRNTLIERNLRLVVYIARKFENTGVGVEDLISVGTIGLIKAVNTFNPEKKIKLATYASRCIENEILMYLRRNNKTRMEVSIDEPLNVDWDGNELLLSDVLGTEEDVIYKDIEEVKRNKNGGPASYIKLKDAKGKVGFISAISNCFCEDCNRVRLTSEGFLKQCLHFNYGIDLKKLLRNGASEEEILNVIKDNIYNKPEKNLFLEKSKDKEL